MGKDEQERIANAFKSIMRDFEKAENKEEQKEEVEMNVITGSIDKVLKKLSSILPKEVMEDIKKNTQAMLEAKCTHKTVERQIGKDIANLVNAIPDELIKREFFANVGNIVDFKSELFSIIMSVISFLVSKNEITINKKEK